MSMKSKKAMTVVLTSRVMSPSSKETSSSSTRWYRESNDFVRELESAIGNKKVIPSENEGSRKIKKIPIGGDFFVLRK
jgi:hypothetical protein